MPKLKKKLATEDTTPEVISGEAENTEPTEAGENANLNADEEQALAEQQEEDNKHTIRAEKLDRVLKVVHDTFNLDGYSVMSFKDNGNKAEVSVTNGDFDITIKIRDCEAHNIF